MAVGLSPRHGKLRSVDFERALSQRPKVRSEHFVLHHVAAPSAAADAELSTTVSPTDVMPVDHLQSPRRFGLVVPKRHARRSVTRSLIKRQGRSAMERHAHRIGMGDWVLRLRAPFAKERFPSAASDALRTAVRAELELLFGQAAGRAR